MSGAMSNFVQPFPDPFHMLENLKPIVWSLKIVGKEAKEEPIVYARACGFCVSTDGYIMTCASIFTDFDSTEMEIRVRRLDQDTFMKAKLKSKQPQWDLALLKIKADDCECGSFSQEGELRVGQPILYIGRSSHFVGSCRYGSVAFGCTNIMSLPPPNSNVKCQNYDFDPYSDTTSQPPNSSNMGCFWNKMFFAHSSASSYKFEKQLHPHVPVIQCDGFSTNNSGHFGNPESQGSPVFNLNGDIVGMLSSKFQNYDIAVHVSALRSFKTDSIAQGPSTKDDSTKGKGRHAAKKTRTK